MIGKPTTILRRLALRDGVRDLRDADLRARGQALADRLLEAQWRLDVANNNARKLAQVKQRNAGRCAA